jgi:hypothetical protein
LGSESVVTVTALANNVSVFPLVASFAPNACGGFGFKQGSGRMWESKTEINLLFNKGITVLSVLLSATYDTYTAAGEINFHSLTS